MTAGNQTERSGVESWTIRVCKHGEVVTFDDLGHPLHVWEPGGGHCDDNATQAEWVEVVRREALVLCRGRADRMAEALGDLIEWASCLEGEGPLRRTDTFAQARSAVAAYRGEGE